MKIPKEYEAVIVVLERRRQVAVFPDKKNYPKIVEKIQALEKENDGIDVQDWFDGYDCIVTKFSVLYKSETVLLKIKEILEAEGISKIDIKKDG